MSKPHPTPSLPTDPLAALLSHGSDQVKPGLIAQRIAQGQWHVDPAYTHEGLNLVELLASNNALTNQAEGAIELVCALAGAGVTIVDNAWERVDVLQHGNYDSKPVKLLLRGVSEGESLATMRDACRVLDLFRPIKPVVEQANKVLDAVQAIGGWGRAIQGVSLATWLVCHDEFFHEGGYTQSAGTDDEKQTWERLRKRVFGAAMQPDGSWTPDDLDRVLLKWRACDQTQIPSKTKADAKDMEALLDGISGAHPRIQALASVRLLASIVPHTSGPKKYSFDDPKPIPEKVSQFLGNIEACMKRLLCGVDMGIAAEKSIIFFLQGNLDIVSGLPLNEYCVQRIVRCLMEKERAPGRDAGAVVQQWVAAEPAMLEHARQCAREYMDMKKNAAQDARARLETFWLSLSADAAPTSGVRGLRL